mgnify:CR=1 FL=1
MHPHEDLPVFKKWLDFTQWLMPVVDKFPKRVRFTLSDRIINLLFDVVEGLVDAQYSRQKQSILKQLNLKLEKIRVLLRIAHQQQFLSHQSHQQAIKLLNESGRMLGGWIKQQSNS